MSTHMITRKLVQQCGIEFAQKNMQYDCRNAMIHGSMEGMALSMPNDV